MKHVRPAVITALVLAAAAAAYAQPAVNPTNGGFLDTLTDQFEIAATSWETSITAFAQKLFAALALIEFIYSAMMMALKGQGIQDFAAEMVRKIFFFGFGYAVLLNAHEWSRAIVNSFQHVGAAAVQGAHSGAAASAHMIPLPPDGALKPSAIAQHGIFYAGVIMTAAPGLTDVGAGVFFAIGALVVLLGFAAIALREVSILAEMYICLSAGILILGFGGSRWTNHYSKAYLRYCVSVGCKLFFVQLTVALAISFLNSFMLGVVTWDIRMVASTMLALCILVAIVFHVPKMAAGMLSGHSAAEGGEAMSAMKAVAAAGAAVATGAIGGVSMVAAAAKLTSAQGAQAAAGSGAGAVTGALKNGGGGTPGGGAMGPSGRGGGGGGNGSGPSGLANGMAKPPGTVASRSSGSAARGLSGVPSAPSTAGRSASSAVTAGAQPAGAQTGGANAPAEDSAAPASGAGDGGAAAAGSAMAAAAPTGGAGNEPGAAPTSAPKAAPGPDSNAGAQTVGEAAAGYSSPAIQLDPPKSNAGGANTGGSKQGGGRGTGGSGSAPTNPAAAGNTARRTATAAAQSQAAAVKSTSTSFAARMALNLAKSAVQAAQHKATGMAPPGATLTGTMAHLMNQERRELAATKESNVDRN